MSVRTLGAVATAALFASGAQAQLDELLLIDLSVPNQVTLTATAGLSAATVSGNDVFGVYFEDFYAADGSVSLGDTYVSGDLVSAGSTFDGTPELYRDATDDRGLNMYSWATESEVTFTAGALAFTGSTTWTVDPARYAEMLNNNTVGNIYFPADEVGDLGVADLIGTYRVVPAPGAATLLGLSLGLGAVRRRR